MMMETISTIFIKWNIEKTATTKKSIDLGSYYQF